jgi:hypothetical protein
VIVKATRVQVVSGVETVVRARADIARQNTPDRMLAVGLSGLVLLVVIVLTSAHTGAAVALN